MNNKPRLRISIRDIFWAVVVVALCCSHLNIQKQLSDEIGSKDLQSSPLLNPIEWSMTSLADTSDEKILLLRTTSVKQHELLLDIDGNTWQLDSQCYTSPSRHTSELCILLCRIDAKQVKLSLNARDFHHSTYVTPPGHHGLHTFIDSAIAGVGGSETKEVFRWDDGSQIISIKIGIPQKKST